MTADVTSTAIEGLSLFVTTRACGSFFHEKRLVLQEHVLPKSQGGKKVSKLEHEKDERQTEEGEHVGAWER